jgi:hypothetical protein
MGGFNQNVEKQHFVKEFESRSDGETSGTTEQQTFACEAIRILQVTATGGTLSPQDLASLERPLGKPVRNVSMVSDAKRDNFRRRGISIPRYVINYTDPIRDAAQELLDYLNLTTDVEPVHTMCKRPDCRNLLMKVKGGRIYCSKDCLNWSMSYAARKDKIKALNRRKKEQAQRQLASKEGKHGRTSSRKA